MKFALLFAALFTGSALFAQDDDLLKLVGEDKPKKEYVENAFKSSRVINGHSMEMIARGNLDFRILHRFGLVNSGAKNFFGSVQGSVFTVMPFTNTNEKGNAFSPVACRSMRHLIKPSNSLSSVLRPTPMVRLALIP